MYPDDNGYYGNYSDPLYFYDLQQHQQQEYQEQPQPQLNQDDNNNVTKEAESWEKEKKLGKKKEGATKVQDDAASYFSTPFKDITQQIRKHRGVEKNDSSDKNENKVDMEYIINEYRPPATFNYVSTNFYNQPNQQPHHPQQQQQPPSQPVYYAGSIATYKANPEYFVQMGTPCVINYDNASTVSGGNNTGVVMYENSWNNFPRQLAIPAAKPIQPSLQTAIPPTLQQQQQQSYVVDELTEIVNQVLNSVESTGPIRTNTAKVYHHPSNMTTTTTTMTTTQHRLIRPKPCAMSEGNLCHHCGSIVAVTFIECHVCGEPLQTLAEIKSRAFSKTKSPPRTSSTNKSCNVGVVEPRVVVKIPFKKTKETKRGNVKSSVGRNIKEIEEDIKKMQAAVKCSSEYSKNKSDVVKDSLEKNMEKLFSDENNKISPLRLVRRVPKGFRDSKKCVVNLKRQVQSPSSPSLLKEHSNPKKLCQEESYCENSGKNAECKETPKPAKITIENTDTERFHICPMKGCSFNTNKFERMNRHVRCHTKGSNRNFRCPDCGVRFFSLAKMLKHDRRTHTGVKDYECRLCEAEVTDIVVHTKVHKEEKNLECEFCSETFRHRHSLIRHLFQHSGNGDQDLLFCGTSSGISKTENDIPPKRTLSSFKNDSVSIQSSEEPLTPSDVDRDSGNKETIHHQQQQQQPQPSTMQQQLTASITNSPVPSFTSDSGISGVSYTDSSPPPPSSSSTIPGPSQDKEVLDVVQEHSNNNNDVSVMTSSLCNDNGICANNVDFQELFRDLNIFDPTIFLTSTSHQNSINATESSNSNPVFGEDFIFNEDLLNDAFKDAEVHELADKSNKDFFPPPPPPPPPPLPPPTSSSLPPNPIPSSKKSNSDQESFQEKLQKFSQQLKSIRERRHNEEKHIQQHHECQRCGRRYKFENFLKVHLRRCA